MAEGQKKETMIVQLTCQPGIQRDGTQLDSKSFIDGQWVRFQRGRPKKMNGYRELNRLVNGPVRGMNTWSRQELTQITTFSPWGVEAIQLDRFGTGQAVYDRTPAGFTIDGNAVWQTDTMYDAAAGSTKTLLFAHPGANLANIDSGFNRDVYYGEADGISALLAVGGATQVSGGLVCLPPYLVIYGSDGRVSWSNENEPRNFTTGSSGTARVTGSKIVKGLPIRGQGNSPSALLWSIDSVIRMTYVGGQAIFRFDPITNASTILSSSSVIEYDGIFYWVGMDRFMKYDGRVRELPNLQNNDWFFDGLNYNHQQKVFAYKVPRYGEIWWYYPRGDATECSHAVIYNVKEDYWYDVELSRSSGAYSNTYRFPVAMDSMYKTVLQRIPVVNAALFSVGDTVTGSASFGSGTVRKVLATYIYVASPTMFINGETITANTGSTSTATADSYSVPQHQLWQHEFGKNKIESDNEVGIQSFFETANFGFVISSVDGQGVSPNRWTRLARVEPDFKLTGTMKMQVVGSESANSQPNASSSYEFDSTTEQIDLREQRRELRLRFADGDMNSDYEMGKILLHVDVGDGRN